MAPKLAKGMDPLGDISSDDEASGSEGGDAAAPAAAPAPPKPKEVDFEALQKAGYKGQANPMRSSGSCAGCAVAQRSRRKRGQP
jgi:hypothetical protein